MRRGALYFDFAFAITFASRSDRNGREVFIAVATTGRRRRRDYEAPLDAHLSEAWIGLRLAVIGCVAPLVRLLHVTDEELSPGLLVAAITDRACAMNPATVVTSVAPFIGRQSVTGCVTTTAPAFARAARSKSGLYGMVGKPFYRFRKEIERNGGGTTYGTTASVFRFDGFAGFGASDRARKCSRFS